MEACKKSIRKMVPHGPSQRVGKNRSKKRMIYKPSVASVRARVSQPGRFRPTSCGHYFAVAGVGGLKGEFFYGNSINGHYERFVFYGASLFV